MWLNEIFSHNIGKIVEYLNENRLIEITADEIIVKR